MTSIKNETSQETENVAQMEEAKKWDSYNYLMKCSDVDRLRKVLARFELFKLSVEVPGDIVECGVLKGTGLMQFLKMREILMPGSIKKVIGFDLFNKKPELDGNDDILMARLFYNTQFTGIEPTDLLKEANAISLGKNNTVLVPGDVCFTCQEYADEHPGFRISFLNMDLDVAEPTLKALEALWPRVCKGGVVIFDEYGVHKWSESQAVDQFFKDKPGQKMRTLPWANSPTAYIIKE